MRVFRLSLLLVILILILIQTEDQEQDQDHEQEKKLNLAEELRALLGAEAVSDDAAELLAHGGDKWVANHPPDVVVFAKSTEQVSRLLRFASEKRFRSRREERGMAMWAVACRCAAGSRFRSRG